MYKVFLLCTHIWRNSCQLSILNKFQLTQILRSVVFLGLKICIMGLGVQKTSNPVNKEALHFGLTNKDLKNQPTCVHVNCILPVQITFRSPLLSIQRKLPKSWTHDLRTKPGFSHLPIKRKTLPIKSFPPFPISFYQNKNKE